MWLRFSPEKLDHVKKWWVQFAWIQNFGIKGWLEIIIVYIYLFHKSRVGRKLSWHCLLLIQLHMSLILHCSNPAGCGLWFLVYCLNVAIAYILEPHFQFSVHSWIDPLMLKRSYLHNVCFLVVLLFRPFLLHIVVRNIYIFMVLHEYVIESNANNNFHCID